MSKIRDMVKMLIFYNTKKIKIKIKIDIISNYFTPGCFKSWNSLSLSLFTPLYFIFK